MSLWTLLVLSGVSLMHADDTYIKFETSDHISIRAYGDPTNPLMFLIPGGAGYPFPYNYPDVISDAFFVVTYDQCSVRDSHECTKRTAWSQYEADVRNVYAELRTRWTPSKTYIAGFSGGAFSALTLVRELRANGDAVDGLILISPVADFEKANKITEACLSERFVYAKGIVDQFGLAKFLLRNLYCGMYCVQTRYSWNVPLCRTPFESNIGFRPMQQMYAQREALKDEYLKLMLEGSVDVPVHVLTGALDRIAPSELLIDMDMFSPNMTITSFSESSHMIRYEEPDKFATTLHSILL